MRKRNIFAILDKNYVHKLFDEKKLVYFPDAKDKKIEEIEIQKISPEWAKETCQAKYKIIFTEGDFKIIRGTTSKNGLKRNAWKILKHLFRSGFNRGQSRVTRPLDFIDETGLLLYEEAKGAPLTTIIQTGKARKIKEFLKNSAKWLSKLHRTAPPESGSFPDAIFLKVDDYNRTFTDIKKILPDLKNELIPVTELKFIDQISKGKEILIHNDFYPGNIIIDDAIICGIDFERSGLGFQLIDVATLLGWFEFPTEAKVLNFSEKNIQNFQTLFLKTFCDLSRMDYTKTQQELNKFLAKIFLDQIHNYTTLAIKARDCIGPTVKNDNRKKISALLQKAKHYISLI
ncbi:MAG: hypothetical protein LiPW39_144 [Parcubacteria group bacterium LiPW_39]|nr:MAG: hypothetical protein LiPW39_144 [Parcubacteria group bacterium LiPW_39]